MSPEQFAKLTEFMQAIRIGIAGLLLAALGILAALLARTRKD